MAEQRKEALKELLSGKPVQISLSDDRVVKGTLECFDKGKNIMLADTVQVHKDNTVSHLGFVMLPGAHVKKVELLEAA